MHAQSLSRVWLCDPVDCSLPGSSAHGILQARILEWGAISFSKCYWSAGEITVKKKNTDRSSTHTKVTYRRMGGFQCSGEN